MSQNSKMLLTTVGGLTVLGLCSLTPDADARPQYLKKFTENYPQLAEAANQTKCGLCHAGQNKKVRNAFGKAMEPVLTNPNEKNDQIISNALQDAEKATSADGRTFGEMIKAGELPK